MRNIDLHVRIFYLLIKNPVTQSDSSNSFKYFTHHVDKKIARQTLFVWPLLTSFITPLI